MIRKKKMGEGGEEFTFKR